VQEGRSCGVSSCWFGVIVRQTFCPMNKHAISVIALFVSALSLHGQTAANLASSVVERGPHHRIWESVVQNTDANGVTEWTTNSYREIQTGLHFWEDNQWKVSVPEFEYFADKGFVARRGQVKVILSSRLELGGIDVQTSSGRFRSHVLGLSYFDAVTGESAMITSTKGVEGQLVAPNQVIYPDCFDKVHADLRMTITRYGFEQDIILREPIAATPEAYGMDVQHAYLECVTEFIETPEVIRTVQITKSETNSLIRASMVEPDQTDDILDFGTTTFGTGKAFILDDAESPDIRVNKAFRNVNGRSVLFESIPYETAAQMMKKLTSGVKKEQQHQYAVGELKAQVQRTRNLPKPSFPKVENKQMASLNAPGVILDYSTIETSQTNVVFAANVTTFVSGPVFLYGTNTSFEGGTVIKMAPTNSAKLQINSAITWTGGPYRPVVVTARDDNSAGESITNSTGTPVTYPGPALSFTASSTVRNLRVAYAQIGVQAASGITLEIDHGQFLKCSNAVQSTGAYVNLRNVLFNNVTNVFSGATTVGRCEHLTVNGAGAFNYNNACPALYVTNSLLIGVTSLGSYTGVASTNLSSATGVFQSVWGGAHYLATNSPYRNLGSTNINADLIKDFRRMTTYPPTLLSSTVSVDTVLGPAVQRENDVPDLGYHYDALDYVGNQCTITNASLTLTNGVTIADSNSVIFWVQSGAKVVSEGLVDQHNVLTRYYCVQEQPYVPSPSSGGVFVNTYSTAPYPQLYFRLTDFRDLADGISGYSLYASTDWMNSSLLLRDCEFSSAKAVLGSQNNSLASITNCLFERTAIEFRDSSNNLAFYNNTISGSSTKFMRVILTNSWWAQNNLFDNVSFSFFNRPSNSFNGYFNTTVLVNSLGNDVVLTNLTYQKGTFGRYYQTTTSTLINAGSMTAASAGLYHYTTQTNNVKEANTTVDIGYHYVAADANGNPNDQDGDGIPDYLEDRNGNGVVDSGETDYTSATDLGLKVTITRPKSSSIVP
jgi:hypothetical protein